MRFILTPHRPETPQPIIGVSTTRDASCCCTPCDCTRVDGYELNNRAMDPSVEDYAS